MKSSFLLEMKTRGFLNQCTDLEGLDNILNAKSISAYIGFRLYSSKSSCGKSFAIMILRLLQKHGHRPIVLLGGGTTSYWRSIWKRCYKKDFETIRNKKNINQIKNIFKSLLDFKDKKTKPIFVDNYKWLGKLQYIDFLRDIGKHFTINKMLSFDSVKLRLERENFKLYGV